MTATLYSQAQAQKIVIAHRGASGYLPEHTLEAKVMAYAMDADYIEQDVVMTSDDQLIVLHDITLDRTMYGSDQAASLEPEGLIRMIRDIRSIEKILGDGTKRIWDSELPAMKKLRQILFILSLTIQK